MRVGKLAGHRARWYVWADGPEGRPVKIPREATMRGRWGYDVTCECGWQTNTGGATRTWIEGELMVHRILAEIDSRETETAGGDR
jgi:hypothetical protein